MNRARRCFTLVQPFLAYPLTPHPFKLARSNPTLNGFISTGFDGRLTVWDARRAMTPLRSWAVAGSADTRLTRAAMLGPDLAVCGGMDGRVYAWDFDWLRATTRADT